MALSSALAVALCLSAFSRGFPAARGEDDPTTSRFAAIQVLNPLDGAVFPPEMPPPRFEWSDDAPGADAWRLEIEVKGQPADAVVIAASKREWTPDPALWESLKAGSGEATVTVTITGRGAQAPERVLSSGRVGFSTSKDAVGAPLFYREVNLPFLEAVKDPRKIRWRFGPISSAPPPVVLQNLPVCGNCHSFSADGSVLGMDVDYANSKGSYAISTTGRAMALQPKDVITWDSFRPEDGELTFGLLSQVSPDGRRVVSTVKDKSVFVPRPDLAFSQLFFPIRGILVVYERATKTFAPLPGADDPAYVQSNPVWSPDGKHIVFARARAYDLRKTLGQGKVLLTPDECREFTEDGKPFRFDLYRVPYNDGRGGTPEPLAGASRNDRSNFFPRYSPDGKWIVFCQAANYMLLQPDSELYIMPAAGGQPRRLRANTARMNSWHSWSPNGRWLVFSSKARSAYTQLCLTHIDEQGESSPAVFLPHMTSPDRAANIPEFVNLAPDGIAKIDDHFLNDYSFERAGNELYRAGDTDRAIAQYQEALKLNPANANAHQRLGFLLYNARRQFDEGLVHTREALRLNPANGYAHSDLAVALINQGRAAEAIPHLEAALQGIRLSLEAQYQPQALRLTLADALLRSGRYEEASVRLTEALALDPGNAPALYMAALAAALQGQLKPAEDFYARAVATTLGIDTSAVLHDVMAANYAKAGRMSDAVRSAEHALRLAEGAGKKDLAAAIRQRLERFRAAASHP